MITHVFNQTWFHIISVIFGDFTGISNWLRMVGLADFSDWIAPRDIYCNIEISLKNFFFVTLWIILLCNIVFYFIPCEQTTVKVVINLPKSRGEATISRNIHFLENVCVYVSMYVCVSVCGVYVCNKFVRGITENWTGISSLSLAGTWSLFWSCASSII